MQGSDCDLVQIRHGYKVMAPFDSCTDESESLTVSEQRSQENRAFRAIDLWSEASLDDTSARAPKGQQPPQSESS